MIFSWEARPLIQRRAGSEKGEGWDKPVKSLVAQNLDEDECQGT